MLAKKVFYSLVVLVVVAMLSISALALALASAPRGTQSVAEAAPSTTSGRSITVVGTGKLTGKPDVARVTVGIETQAPSLQKAVDDNKAKMSGLLETLKKIGLADKDIRTSNYSVYTERVSPPAAGANNIYGVNFSVEDTAKLEAEARTEAVANGKARAEELAQLNGLELGEHAPHRAEVLVSAPAPAGGAKIRVEGFSFFYPGGPAALRGVTLAAPANRSLGIVGPASSGKSTLLRSLNRMTDFLHGTRHEGRILLDGADIHAPETHPAELRRRVGMVYDTPVPLPRSIYENVVYGQRLKGVRARARLDAVVESSLRAAILWDEVKDRLGSSPTRLSGGQQQRLCVARTLALEPEVILLDEPCSGLDPISPHSREHDPDFVGGGDV